MKNKRAQVGETITWIIATIVLIGVIMIFIYISVAMSKTKSLEAGVKEGAEDSADWINSKTELAYSINPNNKVRIQRWISQKTEEMLDE